MYYILSGTTGFVIGILIGIGMLVSFVVIVTTEERL